MDNDTLFEKYVELRHRYSLEDLVFVFTRKKAEIFESMRLKFFCASA